METTQADLIEQIAQSVFATMLNIDLLRSDEAPPPDHESLLANVHIAGEWTGSVVLALSSPAARAAAAVMLQISADEVTDADQREVASELVNMIGGNLKSLLPGPSFLSLPTIITGREFGVQVRDAELIGDVVLNSDAGTVHIRAYSQIPSSN